ncbi:MAG TPA: hypothetical protein VGS08_01995 [Candidatus Saccharimonadales bacterium]|nr:hypothetical protein [Candidatus Saccharimonadales bacterium]
MPIRRRQSPRQSFDSPAAIILSLSIVCLAVTLYFTQRSWAYNSDDVAWQTILLSWHLGHTVYLGAKDNFISHVPFFQLLGYLFAPSRTVLGVEATIMAVLNFILFFVASRYFLRRCKVPLGYSALLPFLWLASSGYGFEQLFLNSNWRDFEVGVSFIFFMLAARYYYDELYPLRSKRTIILTGLACAVVGAYVYSDPYFFYFTLVPIVLFFEVLYLVGKVDKSKTLFILGAAIVSIIIAWLIELCMSQFRFLIPKGKPIGFAGFHHLIANSSLAVRAVFTIFGASFAGVHGLGVALLAAVCNSMVILFVAYVLYQSRAVLRMGVKAIWADRPHELWRGFLGALTLLVLLAYILSSTETDILTYRYLIILIFACTLLIALYQLIPRKDRWLLNSLLVLATLLNLANSYNGTRYVNHTLPDNQRNSANYAVINTVQRLGLSKGYSGFWDANINTYLSKGRIWFLPITCSTGRAQPLHLLVDSTLFTQPSARSFYLVDPDISTNPPLCSQEQIIMQFGEPNRTVKVLGRTILIYNHDLM